MERTATPESSRLHDTNFRRNSTEVDLEDDGGGGDGAEELLGEAA